MIYWLDNIAGIISSQRNKPKIIGPFSCKHFDKSNIFNLYFFGDLYGAYVNGKVLSNRELKSLLLKNSTNKKVFYTILCGAIGDFAIILINKKKVLIYTSSGAHGIFYTILKKKIIISDLPDSLIPLQKSLNLLDFEVLQWVIYDGGRPSPFNYIFKQIKCLRGGCRLSFSKTSKINIESYNLPYFKQKGSFNMYVEALEGQAKALSLECKRQKKLIYSMFSGGIDSTVLTLSILSVGGKVQPITCLPLKYHDEKAFGKTYREATLISKAIGKPTKFIPFDEFDNKIVKKQHKINNGSLFHPSYLEIASLGNSKLFSNKPSLVFGGGGKDTIGWISYTHPFFRMPLQVGKFSISLNPKFWLGFQYSKLFQSAVLKKNLWQQKIRKFLEVLYKYKFNFKNLPANAYEYLLNQIITSNDFVFNCSNTFSVAIPKKLLNEFKEYKADTVLKKIIGNLSLWDLKNNNLSVYQMADIARRIAYTTWYWCIQGNYYAFPKKIGQYNYLSLAYQGPILDFFAGYYLSLKDIMFPKKYEYKYFYNKTGKRYGNLKKIKLTPKQNKRKKLPQKNLLELYSNSKEYVNRMQPFLNPKKSIVIESIRNKQLKKLLFKYYSNVYKNAYSNPDLFSMLNRLYLLESHVRKYSHLLG